MQDNDLGTWESKHILLVLEETCCRIKFHRKGRILPGGKTVEPGDPDDWTWGLTTIKTIQRYAYNSVPVDVVTFISPQVATLAATWFLRYDVDVADVHYYDFARFTKSLTWRTNTIQEIIDTDRNRLARYGQLGRQILWDSEF